MANRLVGGIIGCKDKTSSLHLNGFPYGSNTLANSIIPGGKPPLYCTLTLIAMQGHQTKQNKMHGDQCNWIAKRRASP